MSEESFSILELISESPTTSVYKAHQKVLDRTVLLKVLHKHLLRDKDLVARFSREAKACAMLHSENIVQVYDLTEIGGAPAIVMEYVDGKSLEDLIAADGQRSEESLLSMATSVLKGLSYAHERGVIHRDIKPSNILISEKGIIKVTDFGLASVSDTPSLTLEGSLIGTPAYMSPEQARGEPVDQRTDLFSLGVTLVELLSGEKIFAGRSYTECINRIQSFNSSSLDALSSKCSPAFFQFLKKLLAPDKSERFGTADEALASINSLERTASSQTPASISRRRTKPYLITAGGAVVLLALFVLISIALKRPADKPGVTIAGPAVVADQNQTEAGRSTSTKEISGDRGGQSSSLASKDKMETPGKVKTNVPLTANATSQRTPSATVVEKLDSGYIAVACRPWAKVYIDSEYAGTTPISGSIEVPVGSHTVMFTSPYYAPIVKRVRVQPKLLATVDGDFLKSAACLYVSVKPWGDVYVDDVKRETTPSSEPIIVSAGMRRIRIHNPSFPDITRDLTIKPGDTLRLDFDFGAKLAK